MSLDRKDIRAKLHADVHAALQVLAEVDQVDLGEWIERVVVHEINRRVHDATVIAAACGRLGISGSGREPSGIAGSARE